MRRWRFEQIAFWSGVALLLVGTAAGLVAQPHLHLSNRRVQYGLEHLPMALLASLLFLLLVGVLRVRLARVERLSKLPGAFYVLGLSAVFSLFWLPTVFAGGFDEDDWMLLAAASVRKILAVRPWLSWWTLDSVDGNFRPLGTVLYMGSMWRWFGLLPRPFLLGVFLFNLLAMLLVFRVVRELGYSRVTGAAAALVYMSRSLTYPISTWPSALGDTLAILLCGLAAVALLRAIRRSDGWMWVLHGCALVCFFVATLAKQSAFAFPLIAGLVLLLRPGPTVALPWRRRVSEAMVAVAAYGAVAAGVYVHAKGLLSGKPPYPVELSKGAVLRAFSYAVWYLGTFEFPTKMWGANRLPGVAGFAVVAGVGVLLWRVPRVFGERPRDVAFCLLAAVASISLFVVLPLRVAPYYGSMAAFWMSMAVAIGATRFGPPTRENLPGRVACFTVCALLVVGFLDVRVKQTGLVSSGGYTWGTSGSEFEARMFRQMQQGLANAPGGELLVLTDMPGYANDYACMAILADPKLGRILAYQSDGGKYMANDREGRLPLNEAGALADAKAYNWDTEMDNEEAERLIAGGRTLRLKFRDGKIEAGN